MAEDGKKARIKIVQEKLKKYRLNAILVVTSANLHYLFGYSEEGCLALISRRDVCFFAPQLYFPEIADILAQAKVLNKTQVIKYLKLRKIKKLAFEATNVSYHDYRRWQKTYAPVKLIATEDFIEELRLVKNQSELILIKKAVAITDQVYEAICRFIKPGQTELQVAGEIEQLIRQEGAEPAFKTIVAGGLNSACPHHVNSDRRFKYGDIIILDFGAKYQGYNSDLTRTLFLGKIKKLYKQNYALILKAQIAGIKAVKAGSGGHLVDNIVRRIIAAEGKSKYFVHSTGHGVGLEIHERPRLYFKEKAVLQAGMVVTVEPGIYIPGWGGIRIEDTVLVTEQGCDVLSQSPK